MLSHYSLTARFSPLVIEKPWVANFATAWIATKFTEPVRFAATGLIVPKLARHLGYVQEPQQQQQQEMEEEEVQDKKLTLMNDTNRNSTTKVVKEEGTAKLEDDSSVMDETKK